MKRIAFIMAIVLCMGFGCFAQNQWGGGLFQYGEVSDEDYYYGSVWYALDQNSVYQRDNLGLFAPGLPIHGQDQNMDAPLGGGALLLIGFGAAYALKKQRKS